CDFLGVRAAVNSSPSLAVEPALRTPPTFEKLSAAFAIPPWNGANVRAGGGAYRRARSGSGTPLAGLRRGQENFERPVASGPEISSDRGSDDRWSDEIVSPRAKNKLGIAGRE